MNPINLFLSPLMVSIASSLLLAPDQCQAQLSAADRFHISSLNIVNEMASRITTAERALESAAGERRDAQRLDQQAEQALAKGDTAGAQDLAMRADNAYSAAQIYENRAQDIAKSGIEGGGGGESQK